MWLLTSQKKKLSPLKKGQIGQKSKNGIQCRSKMLSVEESVMLSSNQKLPFPYTYTYTYIHIYMYTYTYGTVYGNGNFWFELNITDSSTDNILLRHCIPYFDFWPICPFFKGDSFFCRVLDDFHCRWESMAYNHDTKFIMYLFSANSLPQYDLNFPCCSKFGWRDAKKQPGTLCI